MPSKPSTRTLFANPDTDVDAYARSLADLFDLDTRKPLQAVVAKTRIKDVASFVAKSGLAKRLTTAAEGSFVARAANKLLPTPASLERGVAKFMAESAENAVGAVPSTFVGMALDDNTWKGDPLHTFLSGGRLGHWVGR